MPFKSLVADLVTQLGGDIEKLSVSDNWPGTGLPKVTFTVKYGNKETCVYMPALFVFNELTDLLKPTLADWIYEEIIDREWLRH